MTAQRLPASIRWSCVRKRRFSSYRLAEKIAAKMRRRDEEAMQVYGCKPCGGWHIGHRSDGQ